MPHRNASRGLLYGGIGLVLLSGAVLVTPVLWSQPGIVSRVMDDNDELARISRSVDDVRDVIDALHEAGNACLAYLLTQEEEERAAYERTLQTARESLIDLHPQASVAFQELARQILADMARAVTLQDEGQHDKAIQALDVRENRRRISEVDELTSTRIDALRGRYRDTVDRIRQSNDLGDRVARIGFGLAGGLFALGCVALGTYHVRRTATESALRLGRDAALEASAMKTQFVATASHDLRQPLHAISMFVGVLRRRTTDPAILSVVENIATAVASMQRMFAALLDVARLDAGAVYMDRRSVALAPQLDALKTEFAPSAAAKGLLLDIQPTPLSVSTDPALLETILRNLLSNAIKFTDSGTVSVTSCRRDALVDIVVADSGIGIAEEDQSRIFGQFERLSHSSGPREGLGLGLAIVKRMADLLDITIALHSQPGVGSRFTLSLPFVSSESSSIPDKGESVDVDLQGRHILVIDDNAGARKAISLAIKTLGAIPIEAGSSEEAFAVLADMRPELPAAAVVDHDLGHGQTGPAFLDAYASRSGHPLLAVVMTGSTEAATLASLIAAGRPWLIKPVDLDALRSALSTLLANNQGPGPGQDLP